MAKERILQKVKTKLIDEAFAYALIMVAIAILIVALAYAWRMTIG
jgi:hypothetical protein